MPSRTQRFGRIVFLTLGGLVLVLATVRSSVASLHRANGASDAPTIRRGEVFFVNRLAFDFRLPLSGHILVRLADPRRGDMVLFSMPGSGHLATKRVAAVPGDVVEVRAGRLVLNGVSAHYRTADAVRPVPDDRTNILIEEWGGTSHFVICPAEEQAAEKSLVTTVPASRYFLLGDNRDQSLDSRHFGPVPREAIRGRVMASSPARKSLFPRRLGP